MYLGDLIKCPECGKFVEEENILVERTHIRTKKSYTDKGIVGCEDGACPVINIDNIPICEKMDILFAKCTCSDCNNIFNAMVPIETTPITSFSAFGKDKLVILTN